MITLLNIIITIFINLLILNFYSKSLAEELKKTEQRIDMKLRIHNKLTK